MIAVAIAGMVLGWRQYRVYQGLRESYEERAESAGDLEELARRRGSISHEEWLAQCREIDRKNREGPFFISGGNRLFFFEPDPPEVERRMAEYWGRMKAKYERAARRPWLPVEPDAKPPR